MRKVHSPQEMKQGSCDSGFALINANSIHHSYNKCVTIHSTQNVTIHDNVCARIVGHIFYEEVGDEANITFKHNLGLGAMSNSFDINNGTDMSRDALITQYWWPGDNLANLPNLTYDGFLIKDTDNQHNGTAGQCFKFEPNKTININGSFVPDDNGKQGSAPPCRAGAFYLEPPAVSGSSIPARYSSAILSAGAKAKARDIGTFLLGGVLLATSSSFPSTATPP